LWRITKSNLQKAKICRKADLRKSGIEIIGEVPWGTHFCQFYQGKEDLIEILVPYFKQGLENNEFCMWVTSEPLGAEDAKAAFKQKVKNLDEYIKKGQIEILDYSQWYTKTGRFDADKVLEGWVKKEEQAVERGFDGLRLTGNTFWLEKKDWENFANYEAIVNSVIGKHRMLVICSYSLDKCKASEIVDVVSNHQFAIIKKEGEWVSLESSEHKKVEEALRESQERYRALVDNTILGVTVIDTNYKIITANTMLAKLFNKPASDFVGKDCFREYEKREAVCPHCPGVQAMAYGKTTEVETQGLRDDGSHFSVRNRAIPFFGPDGVVKGFIELVEDITEHKRAEEELKLAYKKIQQTQQELIQSSKMAAMGQLAAGISHELNQPLTGIKGFAQAVLMDLEKESPFRNDLNKIVGQVDRMDAIIKNVRFFARKSDFKIVELDINHVVSDSLMLLSQQLKVHNIRVIQELGSDIPKMQGDPNQLQQAFINIINNARDAILSLNRPEPEGGEIRIQTSLSQDKEHVEINFQDTGCGIPEGNLQYIFSPFFTTKSPDNGMGLGLSVTYRIIENHRGKIEFQSKAGEGTIFRIVLPLKEIKHKIKQS